jgi:hypothetical protein
MKKLFLVGLMLASNALWSQLKLHLDSQLRTAYEKKYSFSEGLMCIPFYCDPFYDQFYKKGDTDNLCGHYVFVDKNYHVKVKSNFDLPCWFEPKFGEGLAAVNIENTISFIDTNGHLVFSTQLNSCNQQRNIVWPFRNGKAKVYQGGNGLKQYYQIYYIDKNGRRIPPKALVRVKLKGFEPVLVVKNDVPIAPVPSFLVPVRRLPKGKYPIEESQAVKLLNARIHKDNRLLVYFECGSYQLENMNASDTSNCGKFVFTDTFFNVKIAGGFSLPCAFEPEFSEGLCAVSMDSMIVYIDTMGNQVINTGLKACNTENNKVSTFKNGIATLYKGDPSVRGLYTTSAIDRTGQRVRLLEYNGLDLAEGKVELFKNLSAEEAKNCFVGQGKSNGLWFLIEKTGKVRKKLDLK